MEEAETRCPGRKLHPLAEKVSPTYQERWGTHQANHYTLRNGGEMGFKMTVEKKMDAKMRGKRRKGGGGALLGGV